MKIIQAKENFDAVIQPDPLLPIVECGQAWQHFKDFLRQFPEGENCEEFGVSFGFANINNGVTKRIDADLFQVYFGRLIDAQKESGWCTAEIDFYYRYKINDKLSRLLAALPKGDLETAYCLAEGLPVIHDKMAGVLNFADAQKEIWKEINLLKPTFSDYHFWIW